MSWAKAARTPLPQDDRVVKEMGESGEIFLPSLMATDWMQYLALAPTLGRSEATSASKFQLYLTTRRLLILKMGRLSYALPVGSVVGVDVVPPPGRESGGWNVVRKLYRVETVRVLHRAEPPAVKALFYDAGADTEPFAQRLLQHVASVGGKPPPSLG